MLEQNLNPDALEAATRSYAESSERAEWYELGTFLKEDYRGQVREIVTAYLSALPAQPELQENSKPNQNLELQPDTVNSVEELEALPAKTVILDRIGDVSVIAETREFMCHDGESYTLDEVSADLPATVLYRPVEG